MPADKGKKIRRFYPSINKINILLFGILFVFFPIPIVFLVYSFGFLKSIESSVSYIVILDLVFIISAPFIMFIISYLQSVVIFTNGILSFNPLNNRETFMHWEKMEAIETNEEFSKRFYMIKSSTENEFLWIPTSFKKNKCFVKEISNYVGKNHILFKRLKFNKSDKK